MPFRYDDNLGYWLFYSQRIVAHAFSEALRMCCEEQSKPYVVTPPQWGLLALLNEGDGLTIGIISLKRGLDAPTVTGIVNRLEHNKLVERRHDKEDRRMVKVYLTDEGRDIIRYLYETANVFHGILTSTFSEDEWKRLRTQLQQIIVNVSAVGPGTGDRFGLLPQDFQCDTQE
ncbi:MAG TPA: MarR family transcriptional regulator [Ktedonobacteraceae bacterium]|nr:MarR family transcriptional regulator [Ktedonobacteraceae bacterium]